jgi:hypothetical protein
LRNRALQPVLYPAIAGFVIRCCYIQVGEIQAYRICGSADIESVSIFMPQVRPYIPHAFDDNHPLLDANSHDPGRQGVGTRQSVDFPASIFVHKPGSPLPATLISWAGRASLLDMAKRNASLGQVVGRQLKRHLVSREDADMVLPHLARGVGNKLVAIVKVYTESGVREHFCDKAVHFKKFFFGHNSFPFKDWVAVATMRKLHVK